MDAPAPVVSNTADKGLKKGALGTLSATVIGVSSTAPAYSLAATLGLIAAIVMVGSPAIILVAFVPMLFTASAYYYLNRSDPDCGATFSWVRRAMGPWAGWMGGWGVVIADIVVMPSLAYIAAQYTFMLFGLDHGAHDLAHNIWALLILGCVFIVVMTLITWMGIELSARTQFVLLGAEILALALFSAVALIKVYVSHPVGSVTPSWTWLNPFTLSVHQLTAGVLVTLFIYWGWDTCGERQRGDPGLHPRSRARRGVVDRDTAGHVPDRDLRGHGLQGPGLSGGASGRRADHDGQGGASGRPGTRSWCWP